MAIVFETIDDIVEEIADKLGVYEGKYSSEEKGSGPVHPEDCDCRICFTSALHDRLDEAYKNEQKLRLLD